MLKVSQYLSLKEMFTSSTSNKTQLSYKTKGAFRSFFYLIPSILGTKCLSYAFIFGTKPIEMKHIRPYLAILLLSVFACACSDNDGDDTTPDDMTEEFTIWDLMLASHLWGMYIYPEFQFPNKIHDYLMKVKSLTRFNYHEDYWQDDSQFLYTSSPK